MRLLVLLMALFGAAVCGLMGWGWTYETRQLEGQQALHLHRMLDEGGVNGERASTFLEKNQQFKRAVENAARRQRGMYPLLAACPLAIAGGLLAMHGRGFSAAFLLLPSGGVPIVVDPVTGFASGILVAAGLLGLTIRRSGRKNQEGNSYQPFKSRGGSWYPSRRDERWMRKQDAMRRNLQTGLLAAWILLFGSATMCSVLTAVGLIVPVAEVNLDEFPPTAEQGQDGVLP